MSRLPSDQQQHYLPRRLQVTKTNPCHVTSWCLLMVYIPSMVFRSLSQEAMYLAFLLSSSFVRGGTFSFSFWSRNGNNANVKHAGTHLSQQRQNPFLRWKSAEDKTWLDIIHTQHRERKREGFCQEVTVCYEAMLLDVDPLARDWTDTCCLVKPLAFQSYM